MSYLVNVLKDKNVRGFFSNNLYMSKNSANCIIYNIKHKKVLSIIFTYIYILQFGPDCKMNASV